MLNPGSNNCRELHQRKGSGCGGQGDFKKSKSNIWISHNRSSLDEIGGRTLINSSHKMQNRAFVLLAAAGLLYAPTLQGQDQRPAPTVTFQVEVNYVDVDVVVTDDGGNFVSGLTRDDFEVLENGKPQKIDTFSIVQIPVEKPAEFIYEGRPVAPDTQTNRKPFDGRVYVIVLDD